MRTIAAISTTEDHTEEGRRNRSRFEPNDRFRKNESLLTLAKSPSLLDAYASPLYLLFQANVKNIDGGESFVRESFRFMAGRREAYKWDMHSTLAIL